MATTIFPVIPAEIPSQAADTIGRVPAFVFHDNDRTGNFRLVDGKLVERSGKEAVKQWFELMLRQQPGAVPIYRVDETTQPGVDRFYMDRGLTPGFIYAEIERNVRETSEFCPAVRMVDSFDFKRLRRGLQVSFIAYLHTNETVEVTVNVNGE